MRGASRRCELGADRLNILRHTAGEPKQHAVRPSKFNRDSSDPNVLSSHSKDRRCCNGDCVWTGKSATSTNSHHAALYEVKAIMAFITYLTPESLKKYKQRCTKCTSLQRSSCAKEKKSLLRPFGSIFGSHNRTGLKREEGRKKNGSHQVKKASQNWSLIHCLPERTANSG